jgi:hypothetical protein
MSGLANDIAVDRWSVVLVLAIAIGMPVMVVLVLAINNFWVCNCVQEWDESWGSYENYMEIEKPQVLPTVTAIGQRGVKREMAEVLDEMRHGGSASSRDAEAEAAAEAEIVHQNLKECS